MKDKFFSKLDWAAFATATLVTFVVYAMTLGPSVGLEDSGELATAAANLGVPHPPGYPFWTFCSWLFCKAFGWVTYMGHPTPAWCVSLCSAFFGALAAGCTAMLICRSAHDFVNDDGLVESSSAGGPGARRDFSTSLLAFGGGVGGALTFAFSPVEWSQSTIVEIYSLNALFLMLVFLLSYRWMRKPSDRILWLTAFVFGLGLTNYQVLLFAIVPLALVILMKNIGMFRDVFIYLVPVALTYQILQIGQLQRADQYMQSDVINKHLPVLSTASAPSTTVLVIALALLVGSIAAAAILRSRGQLEKARKAVLWFGGAGAVAMLLTTCVFKSANTWAGVTAPVAPLIEPSRYAFIAALLAGSVVAAVFAALQQGDDDRVTAPRVLRPLAVAAVLALVAVFVAAAVPQAGNLGYRGAAYPWGKSTLAFWFTIAVLFALSVPTRRGLCFAVPVAGLQVSAYLLLSHGAMNGLTHPQSWWFGWPIAWNFVLLAMAWIMLPNGRSVAGAAFFTQLGVSFYAYMPIVSDLRNPPMNWGYPRTWEGFKHALMRGQYEAIGFQLPNLGQILNYFEDVRVQFTDLLIPFALVPFAAGHWIVKKENRKVFWQWMVPALVCFLLMSFLLIGLANVKGDLQDGFIQKVKFISSHAMLALWIGYGMVLATVLAGKLSCSAVDRRRLWTACALAPFAIVVVLGLAYGLRDVLVWFGSVWWVVSLLSVKVVGPVLMVVGCTLWAVFSAIVILGPVAMIVWALTLAFILAERMKFGRRIVVVAVVSVSVVGALLAPLLDNYCGNYVLGVNEVAFKLGGSEQNGHTFGWQFGAYQLDGAKAIREQLVADEEPLPDPDWPEPMEKSSIFFGGTDPGRFVPTYMIYSADYRPDVYLITQNALADDTYMSVERDLYGDEIWIPAKEDSAEAFNIYVDEVQRGVRPANGDLKIENGRVQVTGALGVMEINGILTKMMFDHDRLRHSFYVEESYVIPWMYPYLSPHGLIMKINADKTPYDAKTAARDADFWDWYTRRLLDDPMYGRDFAGQKSFSKLRAAIAGLYQKQGRYREAAQAYREAVLLYPASPEAVFRYAQETLLPFRNWDVTMELMDYTDSIDPNNKRTGGLRSYVMRIQSLSERLERVEARRREGKLTRADILELGSCYFELGRAREAVDLLKPLVADARSTDELATLMEVMLEARQDVEAETLLNRYLKLCPKTDAAAWCNLAKLQFRTGRRQSAAASFNQAMAVDRALVAERLPRDKELQGAYAAWCSIRERQQSATGFLQLRR